MSRGRITIPVHLESRTGPLSIGLSSLIAAGTTAPSHHSAITIHISGYSLSRAGCLSLEATGLPDATDLIPYLPIIRVSVGGVLRMFPLNSLPRGMGGGVSISPFSSADLLQIEVDDRTLCYRTIMVYPDNISDDEAVTWNGSDFVQLTGNDSLRVATGSWLDVLFRAVLQLGQTDTEIPEGGPNNAFLRFSFYPPALIQVPLGTLRTGGGGVSFGTFADNGALVTQVERTEQGNAFIPSRAFVDVAFNGDGQPHRHGSITGNRMARTDTDYHVAYTLPSWGDMDNGTTTWRSQIRREGFRMCVSWNPDMRQFNAALSCILQIDYST